tara:strand:- start:755 stop:994 length:240 start_codon:yes stop_codon:yes gene_type:complete
MKLFLNCLFFASLSTMLISCGGGSSKNDLEVEINTQVNTDSSSQNNQANTSQNTQVDTNKIIEQISTYENALFDKAIYN